MNQRTESATSAKRRPRTCCPGPFSLLLFVVLCLIVHLHAQNLESLSIQIRSGNVEQKREALFQIRNLRTQEASRTAIPALKDRNEMVRATAATSVVFLPKLDATAVLFPLLADKAPFVRREAAYAMGE